MGRGNAGRQRLCQQALATTSEACIGRLAHRSVGGSNIGGNKMNQNAGPLIWDGDTSFSIGGYSFTLDYQIGGSRKTSIDNNFIIMKTKNFFNHYTSLYGGNYKRILELGVYQGGSFVFLDQMLTPDKIAAVELNSTTLPALDAYVAKHSDRARVYYGMSQDDVANLDTIVAEDFGGELDLVVDDASHFYEPTKIAFKTLFPKVRPGGMYIIEDWSWSFEPEFQNPTNAWFHISSLANLVVDIMEDMATGPLIDEVTVSGPLIKVRRSHVASGTFMETHSRRDRQTSLL